jgi:diaminopimelate decarboxylase
MLHCFAVKSCPLAYVLHRAVRLGLGLECASIAEVKQALRCGCDPQRVVFDSPCKTAAELRFALAHRVHVNVNSLGELEKVASIVAEWTQAQGQGQGGEEWVCGSVGLRVNPLVGAGAIAELSTATAHSKFGVPLLPVDAPGSTAQRRTVLELFTKHSFLTGVMCHVGSQGMPLSAMTEGVRRLLAFADEVDAACGERIAVVDIGGGLSVNYESDAPHPTLAAYAAALAVEVPALFAHPRRRVITGAT